MVALIVVGFILLLFFFCVFCFCVCKDLLNYSFVNILLHLNQLPFPLRFITWLFTDHAIISSGREDRASP